MYVNSKFLLILFLFSSANLGFSQNKGTQNIPDLHFGFEGNLKSNIYEFSGHHFEFAKGIKGQALELRSSEEYHYLDLDHPSLNEKSDFSVSFWVKTSSREPIMLLSQKDFSDKGVSSQKNAGWAFYSSGGTLAWTIGSGERRLTYERSNGKIFPLNDGKWHYLSMTYDSEIKEFRLYYDGFNAAVYHVNFSFGNDMPIQIGTKSNNFDYDGETLKEIELGTRQLQNLVNEFNDLEVGSILDNEFLSLISNPEGLIKRKISAKQDLNGITDAETEIGIERLNLIRDSLRSNPYTVFQNKKLTKLKPISKIYYLENGEVHVNNFHASKYRMKERLFPADFTIDELYIQSRVLSGKEVIENYREFKEISVREEQIKVDSLTVAVWNIWHGGIHYSVEEDDWDSRKRIAEMLRACDADIILMQETYSSGDFIAAELGFHFATTSDWDYCYQGSNISVLSRYPILELEVPEGAEFMNIGVKIRLSELQEVWAMSNWYGMSAFENVYSFHEGRFQNTSDIPVLFGGDFNAVPHTDGGDSPASKILLNNGFTDAFRSLHPDIDLFPGVTHDFGDRIDQLYYKGEGLENISTKVIHSWYGGFPSDHNLILAKFKLK